MATTTTVEESPFTGFGIAEGAEAVWGEASWDQLRVPVGAVLEACIQGSSVGMGTEEWFALLIREVLLNDPTGLLVGGALLGCENDIVLAELEPVLANGHLHLCNTDPCQRDAGDPPVVHVTRLRLWRLNSFQSSYLSRTGKSALKKAITALAKASKPPKAGPAKEAAKPARRKPALRATGKARSKDKGKEDEGVIEVPSEGEPLDVEAEAGTLRARLRENLRRITSRLQAQGGIPAPQVAGDLAGGAVPSQSGLRAVSSQMVAGTSLQPGVSTPLALGPSEATSAGEGKRLKKRLSAGEDPSSQLLAQALVASEREARSRKEKKDKSRDSGIQKLVDLLQGKKKKRRRRRETVSDVKMQGTLRTWRW